MLNLNTREGAPIRLFGQAKSAGADLQRRLRELFWLRWCDSFGLP
jgi:hypothetical protein